MIIPLPLAGGLVAGSALLAWWNPDLFLRSWNSARSTDEQVDLLNNYWQELWRSATSAANLSPEIMRRLDADMGNWWTYRQSYYEAIFRRALDPRDLWKGGLQSNYEQQLGVWRDRYLKDLDTVLKAAPETREDLIARGVDPETAFKGFPKSEPDYGFFWGLGAVAVLVSFGAWAAFRSEGYRRSRPMAYAERRAASVSRFEPRQRVRDVG